MNKWVILIRGINVGGNMLVKMVDLRQHLEADGFASVKTLLQSGNVVAQSSHKDAEEVAAQVSKLFLTHFEINPRVIVLSASEWDDVMKQNPFPSESESVGKWVQVYFGSDPSERIAIAEFGTAYTGEEVIISTKDSVYVYFPIGIGESALFRDKQWGKLTARLTARNWNTIRKIRDELGR